MCFVACRDDQQDAVFLSADIDISVKSVEGIDLLNPLNPESFDEDQIIIYHLINGVFEEFYESNLDHPKGFSIFEHNSQYRIRISSIPLGGIEEGTTLVEWNETDSDTLKYTIDRRNNGSYVSISKVWFNDKEVWDQQTDNDERHFEIVK